MVIDVGDHRIYPDHPSPGGPVIQGHSSKLFTPLRPTHAKRPPQSGFVLTGKPETIDLKMRTGDLGLMTWKSPVVDVLSSMRRVPDCCCSHVPGLLRIRHPCL